MQGFSKKQYAGIFHFKFWQYGSWVDVVVDDYLPTIDGELLFVQSDDKWEELYLDITGTWSAGQGGDVALPGGEGVRQAARLL